MADTQLFCAFIAVIFSITYSDDSCGDVKITSPVWNTFNMSVNDWLNMTFQLDTDKCSSPTYIITAEKNEEDRPMIICRIHHNQTSCYKTGEEAMYSCRCVSPSGPVEFWEKLVRPGDVEYRWRWTDVSSGEHGEKKINVQVASINKNVKHFQTTKFILVGVGGLFVVVAVVITLASCQSPRSANFVSQPAFLPKDFFSF